MKNLKLFEKIIKMLTKVLKLSRFTFLIPKRGIYLSSWQLSQTPEQQQPKEFNSIPGPKSYPFIENLLSLKKYGRFLFILFFLI